MAVRELAGLPVLYEDGDILVLDKSEGVATIPERVDHDNCLLVKLGSAVDYKVFVVHRLDKPVSGVIAFAKNGAAHRYLSLAFQNRQVHKMYTALVHGTPPEDQGSIDRPLRRCGSGRMAVDTNAGKPSRTDFIVKVRLEHFSLLEVNPVTGRRHQIRAHLYSLGHAVVGDTGYGDRDAQTRFPRLMLHASRLELPVPSGRTVTIESPLPQSFTTVLDDIRAGRLPG